VKIHNIWKSGILTWDDGHTLCISVIFTWWLPQARKYAEAMRHRRVRIGGPAVDLMPQYLEGCGAEIGAITQAFCNDSITWPRELPSVALASATSAPFRPLPRRVPGNYPVNRSCRCQTGRTCL